MTSSNVTPIGDTVLQQIKSHAPDAPDFIISEWMRTEFQLPISLLNLCSQSALRVWEGKYVAREVVDGKLRFTGRDGQTHSWIVHWSSLPSLCAASPSVACSFREYDGKFYVVIKVWAKDKGNV